MATIPKRIQGNRILIAGSIPDESDPKIAEYGHELVRHLAKRALSMAGGLVIALGSEPLNKRLTVSKTFDWTILEEVDKYPEYPNKKWPSSQGAPVVAVAFGNWEERIPVHRKALWKSILKGNKVELQVVPFELSLGGVMRQEQSKYGDILVTIGGHIGVYHLAQLYQACKKPVIPLNLHFETSHPTASEILSKNAIREPRIFFDYKPKRDVLTAYSKLSLGNELPSIEDFGEHFFDFLNHLPLPTAFYVRPLNSKSQEFEAVENFFRNVVDKVVSKMGYQRFEMETDFSEDIFMNVELFENLNSSSLVIADLTGVRPNCCLELGYALGLGKKFILTAMEGTEIPWDTQTIHCHFWSTSKRDGDRKIKLKEFIKKNVNKNPISK